MFIFSCNVGMLYQPELQNVFFLTLKKQGAREDEEEISPALSFLSIHVSKQFKTVNL